MLALLKNLKLNIVLVIKRNIFIKLIELLKIKILIIETFKKGCVYNALELSLFKYFYI